jgi:hypothetical protein
MGIYIHLLLRDFSCVQRALQVLLSELETNSLTCSGQCEESDARSLRGGGSELGNLKTVTYSFTIFAQR